MLAVCAVCGGIVMGRRRRRRAGERRRTRCGVDGLYSLWLEQQGAKSRLDEMMVTGQRFGKPLLVHHQKRETIGKAPRLVGALPNSSTPRCHKEPEIGASRQFG
jgi:hypothetical protein